MYMCVYVLHISMIVPSPSQLVRTFIFLGCSNVIPLNKIQGPMQERHGLCSSPALEENW